jgi:hypothetical protein
MMTTAAERRTAVQVAKRLRDPNEPPILDHGELDLICRTLLDAQQAFKDRLAPVYRAALLAWPADGYEHWPERLKLQRIVKACRDWESEFGELPKGAL